MAVVRWRGYDRVSCGAAVVCVVVYSGRYGVSIVGRKLDGSGCLGSCPRAGCVVLLRQGIGMASALL